MTGVISDGILTASENEGGEKGEGKELWMTVEKYTPLTPSMGKFI